jgi:hypothetical protein
MHFLVCTRKPELIKILGEGLTLPDVADRLDLINELGTSSTQKGEALSSEARKALTPEVREAMNGVLIEALKDSQERRDISGTRGILRYSDPRICDMAAYTLSLNWDIPHCFELSGSLRTRSRQLIEIRNRWLRKQGKDPEPVLHSQKIVATPENELRPLLDTVEQSKNPETRAKALNAIEGFGLPALHGLRQRIKSAEKDSDSLVELRSLAARLGFVIDEIYLTLDSSEPNKKILTLLEEMKGKPLTDGAITDLVIAITDSPPQNVVGIRIDADRIADNHGIFLAVTLVKGKHIDGQMRGYLRVSVDDSRVVGERVEPASNAEESKEVANKWNRFHVEVEKALQLQPDKKIAFYVELIKKDGH